MLRETLLRDVAKLSVLAARRKAQEEGAEFDEVR